MHSLLPQHRGGLLQHARGPPQHCTAQQPQRRGQSASGCPRAAQWEGTREGTTLMSAGQAAATAGGQAVPPANTVSRDTPRSSCSTRCSSASTLLRRVRGQQGGMRAAGACVRGPCPLRTALGRAPVLGAVQVGSTRAVPGHYRGTPARHSRRAQHGLHKYEPVRHGRHSLRAVCQAT